MIGLLHNRLALLAISFVMTAISYFTSTFWDHVPAVISMLGALAAAIAVVIGALNRGAVKDLHVAVDGRLTELLSSVSGQSRAEGVQEGIDKNLVQQGMQHLPQPHTTNTSKPGEP